MNRLTKRDGNRVLYSYKGDCYPAEDMNGLDVWHVLQRLAAYEDAEEAGELVGTSKVPFDVKIYPSTVIHAGCSFETLAAAIDRQNTWMKELSGNNPGWISVYVNPRARSVARLGRLSKNGLLSARPAWYCVVCNYIIPHIAGGRNDG